MGKVYFTVILILLSYSISAQKELSPEQFNQKLDECYALLLKQDPDKAFDCLKKLEPFVEKSSYGKGIGRFYSQMSEYYLYKGEFEKADEVISEGYQKHEKKLSEEDKTHFRVMELRLLDHDGKSHELLSRIREIFPEAKGERNKAALYSIRASAFTQLGQYEKATSDYYQALRIFKSEKDTLNINTVYNRLGLLNQKLNDPAKALTYYKEAVRYAELVNSKRDLLSVYNNLGGVYAELDSIDKALEYYQKNIELAKTHGSKVDLARVLLNTGDVYLNQKDFPKSFANFNESLSISRAAGIPIGIMYNYRSLGKAYMLTHQFEQARASFDSALVYSQSLGMPDMEAEVYQSFYELYKESGDFKKSLQYYVKSDSIRNELLNREKQKAIAEIEIKYQTELKDQEIEKMHFAFENKQAQIRTLVLGLVSVVAIGGLVVFFLVYRNKALRDLYERNIELMNSFSHKPFMELENQEEEEENQLKYIFRKLLSLLEEEKIYKTADLSLSKAAELTRSNEKYVSSAIALYARTNYSNFINSYRINEAKMLLYQNPDLHINEVMYACGFNSRTTFYDAFKKHTGMSPKQFKDIKLASEKA